MEVLDQHAMTVRSRKRWFGETPVTFLKTRVLQRSEILDPQIVIQTLRYNRIMTHQEMAEKRVVQASGY
jgi:hypothetical protein